MLEYWTDMFADSQAPICSPREFIRYGKSDSVEKTAEGPSDSAIMTRRLVEAAGLNLSTEIFDSNSLWRRVNGDLPLLRELICILAEESPAQLSDIEAAVTRVAPDELQRTAHKLKGSLLQFSAINAGRLASSLEEMGKQRSLEGAQEVIPRLKSEITTLLEALNSMVSERQKTTS